MQSGSSLLLGIGVMGLVVVGAVWLWRQPQNSPATTVTTITARELQSYTATTAPTIIDVRTPEEFASGHLPGAVNIDFYADDFEMKLTELDPNGSYLLYCRSGNRSGQTATLLQQRGYKNIANLAGGVLALEPSLLCRGDEDVC